jgi:YidC/Oxa1 family membrane protein insertase
MWNTLIIQPMLNSLLWIYDLIGENLGLAIILFTILIRLITYPLTVSQMKSSQKMQEMQNNEKWKAIQKKYKDDKEKLAQEQMKIYKELGVNPMASCLPTLIQLPILFGLYGALTQAMAATPNQLLGLSRLIYPFINAAQLIPLNNQFLWMNLGQPERLYVLGIAIPTLTILVVITTWMQSRVMTPPSANPGDQGAQMSKMMNLYMPFMMGMIAYSLASGLAIYFLTSNVIGILQYAAMGKVNWKNLLPSLKPAVANPKSDKQKKN